MDHSIRGLPGRKALLVGAADAVGEAIGGLLIEAGCEIALTTATGDGEEAFALTRIGRRLGRSGQAVRTEAVDVSVGSAVQVAGRKLVKELGGLDVLIAMPALRRAGAADRMSDSDWARAIGINLSGVFFACRSAAREMKEGGVIIILTFETASTNQPGEAAHAASAGGVKDLAQALAKEWSDRGIQVHAMERPDSPSQPEQFAGQVVEQVLELDSMRKAD